MTKEEAIKKLNKFKNIEILYTNQYTILKSDLGEVQEAASTVLNLMKSIDRQKMAYEKTLGEYIEQLKKESQEKDKIIDIMAEQINNYDIDEDVCEQMGQKANCNEFENTKKCKECIKQYFINKANGGKN